MNLPLSARAIAVALWWSLACAFLDATPVQETRPAGLVRNAGAAYPGYTLFAPLRSTTTYLIDMDGEVVHEWPSAFHPGAAVYLLDEGRLLRCGRQPDVPVFFGGGQGGRIQEIAWDGTVLWDFRIADVTRLQHHDIEPLPNGNVLMIAWERKTPLEAIQAGRHPETMRFSEFWPDFVVEVKPRRPDGGEVVWKWHVWDHLVQDLDPNRDNHGDVAGQSRRVNVNADIPEGGPTPRSPRLSEEERERLEALGYLHDPRGEPRADWTHANAVDYHPELDLIVLSVRRLHEFWVIDHSTTTAEAATSSGGRYGRGGDLIARWGNPANHGAGSADDRVLFDPHDAQWIEPGCPGEGNFLVFNNGVGRGYSSVEEVRLPLPTDGDGVGEAEVVWTYTAPEPTDFFAGHVSGAQRLPNGNTLICDGVQGRFFEVTPDGEVVWDYWSPYGDTGGEPDGFPGGVFRAIRIPFDDSRLQGLVPPR